MDLEHHYSLSILHFLVVQRGLFHLVHLYFQVDQFPLLGQRVDLDVQNDHSVLVCLYPRCSTVTFSTSLSLNSSCSIRPMWVKKAYISFMSIFTLWSSFTFPPFLPGSPVLPSFPGGPCVPGSPVLPNYSQVRLVDQDHQCFL